MPACSPKPSELGQRPNVILIDDDNCFCKLLSYKLSSQGFRVSYFLSATPMFQYLKDHTPPDLFILDYFLGCNQPNGLEVSRKIISYIQRPVIILTANNKVETLVSCLNAGADDYLVKTCDIRELAARIETSLRRHNNRAVPESTPDNNELVIDSEIKLNWESECLIHSSGQQILLTQKETALLELFLKEGSRSINRKTAFMALYGFDMEPMNRSIDLLVSRVRRKLQLLDNRYQIKTLRGYGYAIIRN
ncbi:MAG: response regulator transcription factor [Pseudohongiellaceae bacterium]